MGDHIDVRHQQAGLAISRWDTAASGVTNAWSTGKQAVRQHTSRSPWGNDSAGQAFKAAYFGSGGGPEQMIRDGDRIIEDVGLLGEKVRTAVTRTKDTDQGQAGAIQSI
ncbi:hypothetical protein ABGB17_15935 [Sphaerisporangium sp. B11E5]|uniref:hypothetical protein n=1 Tax=Sphaerisporangium sp. B11E5 TaxID=3153563 RepID=UPI00325F22B3